MIYGDAELKDQSCAVVRQPYSAAGLAAAASQRTQGNPEEEGRAGNTGQLSHAERLHRAAAPGPWPACTHPPAQG